MSLQYKFWVATLIILLITTVAAMVFPFPISLGVLFGGFLLMGLLVEYLFLHPLKRLSTIIKSQNKDEEIQKSSLNSVNNVWDLVEQTRTMVTQRHDALQNNLLSNSNQQIPFVTLPPFNKVTTSQVLTFSHFDDLTALPNRVYFNELLNKAINHAKRHTKILAILVINVDNFKKINKEYGYRIGDLVLGEIGQRFSGVLRAGDVIARLGGDEFIVLLNDLSHPKFAGPAAEKILHNCMQTFKIQDKEINVSISIGIAVYPNDGTSLEDLEKNADAAMYKAKHSGGNIYQYYQHEMFVAAHEHIKLETALRNAITNNEFVLHYQPQLNLADGTIKCVEALIRWQHPELGLLGPEKFVPLAEETGLIMPIGEWVILEACKNNKAWQKAGYDPVIVAVNISQKQFARQDISQVIAKALKETRLEPQYLEIEITETAVMENIDLAISKLESVRDMGVRVSIDDFGTGFTSINYLKKFPVSVLKIDQGFIKGVPHNANDVAITTSIITLGHNLGLDVVAEGVENTEQVRYLAEHNCNLIQGYFLSRPLPENKIVLQFTKDGKVKSGVT